MSSVKAQAISLLALLVLCAVASAAPSRPSTRIDGGPPAFSVNRSPRISFSAGAAGATFECRLDGAAFSPCTSPFEVTGLGLGRHSFEVRSVNANQLRDLTPARLSWMIVENLSPPVVTVAGLPPSGRVPIRFLRDLRGTALASAGVRSVQIALRVWGIRRQPSLYSPTYCVFADLHNGKTVVSPCLQPTYITPRGGAHWRLRVRRGVIARLPHLTYELQVRAINGAGEGVIFRKKIEISD